MQCGGYQKVSETGGPRGVGGGAKVVAGVQPSVQPKGVHATSIVGDRFFTVDDAEYRRLQADGIDLTTWHRHKPTGRIMSVPGKH